MPNCSGAFDMPADNDSSARAPPAAAPAPAPTPTAISERQHGNIATVASLRRVAAAKSPSTSCWLAMQVSLFLCDTKPHKTKKKNTEEMRESLEGKRALNCEIPCKQMESAWLVDYLGNTKSGKDERSGLK